MMCTRPDICYTVGLVSRFQSNPGLAHWKAVKRIMRYLKGTADYVLYYQGLDLQLKGYSDADWGSDLDERKSTTGYVFLLNNGAITWSSKKQPCIALSTMEAEYIACSVAVQETVWLRRFLKHLDIGTNYSDPGTDQVSIGDGSSLPIQHTETAQLHTANDNFLLRKLLHVPLITRPPYSGGTAPGMAFMFCPQKLSPLLPPPPLLLPLHFLVNKHPLPLGTQAQAPI
ncbi:secreted RxLR effector protein 161-like [Carya illinoinensis]|uniref:secreted RxLR effector protein 161-like n=1 Tax=Carya illinoinensis TaxID=32201 RepID=UPI001C725B7F|nr:secreted RxLR effector protein 161-like [Carya illinoinensis]